MSISRGTHRHGDAKILVVLYNARGHAVAKFRGGRVSGAKGRANAADTTSRSTARQHIKQLTHDCDTPLTLHTRAKLPDAARNENDAKPEKNRVSRRGR
jgi:hypothetical protein